MSDQPNRPQGRRVRAVRWRLLALPIFLFGLVVIALSLFRYTTGYWPSFRNVFASPTPVSPTGLITDCESDRPWRHGSVDTDLFVEGRGSTRWIPARTEKLELRRCPQDWTARNAISFWLHNNVATDSEVFFCVASDDRKTFRALDYWRAPVRLDFVGWRKVILPKRALARINHPVGWDKITATYLTGKYAPKGVDGRHVLHVDDVRLVQAEGPLLTDQELFESLDYQHPGLGTVGEAWRSGDASRARHRLAEYLRRNSDVPWLRNSTPVTETSASLIEEADRIAQGIIDVAGREYRFPNGVIDWSNPVDGDWQSQLTRMDFWASLGRAYETTGDERYARAFVRQIQSWIRENMVPPDKPNTHSAWSTLDAGIRMGHTWPQAYHSFRGSPSIADDDLINFVKSIIEHGQYLRRNHGVGNWLTSEMAGLYSVGLSFPEITTAREWRRFAIETLRKEQVVQFLPDGAQIELSTGYHWIALRDMLLVQQRATRSGHVAELPEGYAQNLEKAAEYLMRIALPDGTLPRLNDSWDLRAPTLLTWLSPFFPDRQDFRWMASGGAEGMPPTRSSHAFPYAGYFVMRSDWSPQANMLVFDGGNPGFAHNHQDKLHLILSAYGREILYDGGGGAYGDSPWRRFAASSHAHNTVIVDGLSQNRRRSASRTPVDAQWESTAGHDRVAARYDGAYGADHNFPASATRQILFLKPDLFIVNDVLRPKDGNDHVYEARWHLDSVSVRLGPVTGQVTTVDAGKPNLSVLPVLREGTDVRAVSGQTEPEMLGWIVERSGHRPTTTVLHRKAGRGVKQFITLLVPLEKGEGPPLTEITRLRTGFFVSIGRGGRSRKLRLQLREDSGLDVSMNRGDGFEFVASTGSAGSRQAP